MSSTMSNPSATPANDNIGASRPRIVPADILAIATSSDPWSPAVTAAISLAARWGSKLTSCYIEPALRRAANADMEPSVLGMLLQSRGEGDGERERDAFVSHAHRWGVIEADWVVTHAGLAPTLRALGAWHDLAVLERDGVEGARLFDILSEAMSNSRLPCLLLPPLWNAELKLERVVIGWNGSIEATRAIHGALPFLQAASQVLVIDGESRSEDDDAGTPPRFDPIDYLQRHQVAASSRRIQVPPQEAGAALLKATHGIHADLLVMGSFSHSRLRERILGGATRHVLAHAPIPVLMEH
jgi:nucleotide-binding universal stress UspA family protein